MQCDLPHALIDYRAVMAVRLTACGYSSAAKIYTFLSFDVGIRQKTCSRILCNVAWRGCIHAAE